MSWLDEKKIVIIPILKKEKETGLMICLKFLFSMGGDNDEIMRVRGCEVLMWASI